MPSASSELSREGREVPDAARQPVQLRAGENVEPAPPGVDQEAIQPRAPILRPGDAVIDVLLGHLEAPGLGVLAQRVELRLHGLLRCADASVKGDVMHGEILLERLLYTAMINFAI